MYIEKQHVTAYENSQVAFQVGIEKDTYNITSYFKENLITGVITVKHQLIKNIVYGSKHPKYEHIHVGTYKESVELINAIVLEFGEWRTIPGTFTKELQYTIN